MLFIFQMEIKEENELKEDKEEINLFKELGLAAADEGGGDLGTQVRAQLPRGGRGDRRRRRRHAVRLGLLQQARGGVGADGAAPQVVGLAGAAVRLGFRWGRPSTRPCVSVQFAAN